MACCRTHLSCLASQMSVGVIAPETILPLPCLLSSAHKCVFMDTRVVLERWRRYCALCCVRRVVMRRGRGPSFP